MMDGIHLSCAAAEAAVITAECSTDASPEPSTDPAPAASANVEPGPFVEQ